LIAEPQSNLNLAQNNTNGLDVYRTMDYSKLN